MYISKPIYGSLHLLALCNLIKDSVNWWHELNKKERCSYEK